MLRLATKLAGPRRCSRGRGHIGREGTSGRLCAGLRRNAGLACHRFWQSNHPANLRAQRLTRISLVFAETETERTQEFVLCWSPDGGRSFREIVRQQKRDHYLAFLKYPDALRRSLSTTNAVEAINGQLEISRRNSGGYFQSADTVKLKLGINITALENGVGPRSPVGWNNAFTNSMPSFKCGRIGGMINAARISRSRDLLWKSEMRLKRGMLWINRVGNRRC